MMSPAKKGAASKAYRILSIDGGGLRGIIPLTILEKLDAAAPGWRSKINMFAGTSTGGLIALCLAKGMSPSDLLSIYMSKGAFIFERSLWQEVKDLGDVIGPKYDSANREKVCKDVLGDVRLGDLRSKDGASGHMVVTAFDLDDRSDQDASTRRWKAKIFHNLPTSDNSGDEGEYAYRVAMRTSAAPTYFASYDGFVDGGVFANNPSMCALAQTQDERLAVAIPFNSVKLLSLGTGFYPYHLDGDESWGLAQWAPHFVDLLTDGVNEVADFETAHLLPRGNYYRVAPKLQTNIAMDDASEVGVLHRVGSAVDVTGVQQFVTSW
jgi:predicted acylesterase/phospholipase RssA